MKSRTRPIFGKLRKRFNLIFKHKVCFLTCSVILLLYCFGVFTLFFEDNFKTRFRHPLNRNITKYVEQLKRREVPDLLPINVYNYKFIYVSEQKCKGQKPKLVYIIKSSRENFIRRDAIRKSWGFEKRFSDVEIRTVFLLGSGSSKEVEEEIEREQNKYGDLVYANFIDNYYNNTVKTMMGIKWAMVYCRTAKYYFFSDDDFYVSTKNALRFLRNPEEYPLYLEVPVVALEKGETKQGWVNEPKDDVKLYSGYLFQSSHPMRHIFSKWYVSLSEYPYDQYPPYISAGAYLISRQALIDIFYASAYTIHFRFDDIYLAIVAKKIGLPLLHNDYFCFYKKPYNVFSYRYVIASHGYEDPEELLKVWNEQKSAGNA